MGRLRAFLGVLRGPFGGHQGGLFGDVNGIFWGHSGYFGGGNEACCLGAIRGFVRDHRGTGGFGDLLGGSEGFF